MADKFDLVSEKFPTLFHYTTVSAFKNIYKSRQFWATHREDLNDRSELQRFRLKASELIRPIIQNIFNERIRRDPAFAANVKSNGGVETAIRHEATTHLEVIHQTTFGKSGLSDPFISSFCAHHIGSYEDKHGLLSQWRGYGVDGGIAIVFDTKGIEEKMKHEQDTFSHSICHIGDVSYDDADLKKRPEFSKLFDFFPKILEDFYSLRQPPYDEILEAFVLGSTLVKHRGFKEENEVRIVICPRPNSSDSIFYEADKSVKAIKAIKFRPNASGEAKYIELFNFDNERPLPIKRVIIGPSRIQNSNRQTINDLLTGSGIEITNSEIPFLG